MCKRLLAPQAGVFPVKVQLRPHLVTYEYKSHFSLLISDFFPQEHIHLDAGRFTLFAFYYLPFTNWLISLVIS